MSNAANCHNEGTEDMPGSPVLRSQIAKQGANREKADKKLIPRRTALAIVAGAILVLWFWPLVDAFLKGKVVGGLTAPMVAAFTGMVWWSTDRMGRVSAATLQHLRKEFDAEHRPWISVKIEPSQALLFHEDGSGLIYLLLSFTNSGRIPATDVRAHFVFVPPDGNPVEKQLAVAKQMLNGELRVPELGISVFPGTDPATQRRHHVIRPDVVTAWRAWRETHSKIADVSNVHVAGCVTYSSPVHPNLYQTGFIRELHRGEIASDRLWPIDPNGGHVLYPKTTGSILGSGAIT